jgi:hypothetical protein
MIINKNEILKNHCYTKLVYERINKKLNTNFSNDESEALIKKVLEETTLDKYIKKGKNFYISNSQYNIRITINSNTFRVITVDRIR